LIANRRWLGIWCIVNVESLRRPEQFQQLGLVGFQPVEQVGGHRRPGVKSQPVAVSFQPYSQPAQVQE
jgi:hypothetical protein